MKKYILLTFIIITTATFGAVRGSLSNNDEVVTPSELTASLSPISYKVDETYDLVLDSTKLLYGDDCRLISTYYNSVTRMPYLSLQFKMKDEATGTNYWYKVWNEMTRFNYIIDQHLPTNYYNKTEIDIALEQKADRAWGYYDSATGNYAPEGFTWISSPSIAIAGGLAYQRILTTEGAVWVLESNGMTTFTGGETNGYFRISDDKGNALFEITKGTERIVGATANATRTESMDDRTHLFITYNIVSSEHPKLEICRKLTRDVAPDWKSEDDVDCPAYVIWTGSSGAWFAEVYGKTTEPSLFVKGTYKQGAKDVIKHNVPVSLSQIEINGKIHTNLRVEEINGKNVLVVD